MASEDERDALTPSEVDRSVRARRVEFFHLLHAPTSQPLDRLQIRTVARGIRPCWWWAWEAAYTLRVSFSIFRIFGHTTVE